MARMVLMAEVEGGYEGDEVRLGEWCEGGHEQQRNAGGGCGAMGQRSERVESPSTYVTE